MAGPSASEIMSKLKILLQQLRWLIKSLTPFKTSAATCYEIGHTWTPYCRRATFDIFLASLKHSFKLYSFFYLITALLKRRKLDYYLQVVWKDILRSTAFLTANAFTFIAAFCAWRKVMGFYFYANVVVCTLPISACLIQIEKTSSNLVDGFDGAQVYVCSTLASFFSLQSLEKPSRHGMLAMYTTNLALEILHSMLRSRKLIPRIPAGEVLIFSAGLAGFLHLYRKPQALDGFSHKIISTVFGNDEVSESPSMSSAEYLSKLYAFLPTTLKRIVAQIITSRALNVKHKKCTHRWGCVANTLEKYVRCFGMGYALSTALKVPSSVGMLFRRKNPLPQLLLSGDSLSCGAFIAAMSATHQGVSCLLRWLRGDTNPKLDGLISGAVAGLAMLHYRSSAISLYILIRLVDLLIRKKVEEGKLPNIKNAYIYMYALSTGVLFHAAFWEPHNIRPAYWKFMLLLTGNKFALVNRRLIDNAFGTHSAKLYPDFWPQYDSRFTSLMSPDVLTDVSRFVPR